jgi:hypothetical protein
MSQSIRRFAQNLRLGIFCGLAILIAGPASAQSLRVVRVEEHWELRLGQPDSGLSAPQTTMVMSPDDDLEGVHFQFTLNHATIPQYAPGGMQAQLWDGEELLDQSVTHEGAALQHADEVVRWIQRVTLDNGTLTFQILNGSSETWGDFGGDDFSLSVPTSLSGLNGYRPGVSLTESQVGYAENRVVSLTLTKLVWVTDDGEVHELDAPIEVDTSLDP